MDRILYKEANGDLTCRARDFDKVFPTLYAYEETGMTPEDIEGLKNSYQQLQEINDNTYRSNMAMSKDLENIKAERDDLALIVRKISTCAHCKHLSKKAYEEPCDSCDKNLNYPNWEWVGRRE